LLDINKEMTDSWQRFFKDVPNIEIHNMDFNTFMKAHEDVEAIVSPANSFGLMDGGYDGAIRKFFLEYYEFDIIPIVQEHLKEKFWGEQPVGSSTLIKLPVIGTYLLHTPTMIKPSIIEDPRVIYHCTRSCILEAMTKECTHIVIPAFGGCCGKVDYNTIAKYMIAAMETFTHSPRNTTWHQVYHDHILSDLALM
jgi:O-acetyl-ADP-ribose deacetylase (regulator of RNase III)